MIKTVHIRIFYLLIGTFDLLLLYSCVGRFKAVQTPITKTYSYRVFLIPIYQELGVPATVDRVEKWACYKFTLKSKALDHLYSTLSHPLLLSKSPLRILRDPRVKVIQVKSKKIIYINQDLRILSADGMAFYQVDRKIVQRAIKTIKQEARRTKKTRKECSPVDCPVDDDPTCVQNTGCHPHDKACWEKEKDSLYYKENWSEQYWIKTVQAKDIAMHKRRHSCKKLEQYGSKKAINPLIDLLDDKELASCAARGLARLGAPQGIKEVIRHLRMGDERTLMDHARINIDAIWALGHYKCKSALPYLVKINATFVPRGVEEKALKRVLENAIRKLNLQKKNSK